jgi:hypothetical protein
MHTITTFYVVATNLGLEYTTLSLFFGTLVFHLLSIGVLFFTNFIVHILNFFLATFNFLYEVLDN